MSYTPLANTPALESLTLIKGVSSFLLKSFVYGANTGNMVTKDEIKSVCKKHKTMDLGLQSLQDLYTKPKMTSQKS